MPSIVLAPKLWAHQLMTERRMRQRLQGEVENELAGHEDGINCLALSNDHSIMVSGSEDHSARIWSLNTDPAQGEPQAECIGVLSGHRGYVTCVAAYDKYAFTGSHDGTVKKWDLVSSKCMFTYRGHSATIAKLLVSNDLMFSSSGDKCVRVWHTKPTKSTRHKACIRTLKGHGQAVGPLIFLPDAQMAGTEGTIQSTDDETASTTINPGDLLISGSTDTSAKIWSLYNGECLHTLRGHVAAITVMSADSLGRVLFTGSADGFIRYWDIQTGSSIKVVEGHGSPIISLHLSNRLLFTGSTDGMVKCWVTEHADDIVQYRRHPLSVTAITFYRGLVITGCADGIVRCFDVRSAHLVRTYPAHEGAVVGVLVIRDKIYSCSTNDPCIRVLPIDWDFIKSYLRVLSGDVNISANQNPAVHDEAAAVTMISDDSQPDGAESPEKGKDDEEDDDDDDEEEEEEEEGDYDDEDDEDDDDDEEDDDDDDDEGEDDDKARLGK